MSVRSFVAPSGDIVASSTTAPVGEPYIVASVATISQARVEFVGGNRQQGRLIASEADVELTEFYTLDEGELSVGTKRDRDTKTGLDHVLRLAVWQGKNYSFKCFGYNIATETLLALLDKFLINEVVDGVVLRPRAPDTSWVRDGSGSTQFVQNVPGVGLVESRSISSVPRSELPAWRGLRTSGGDLYLEETEAGTTYVLLDETAFTRLYPNRHRTTDDAALEAFMGFAFEWFPYTPTSSPGPA